MLGNEEGGGIAFIAKGKGNRRSGKWILSAGSYSPLQVQKRSVLLGTGKHRIGL